MVVIDQDLSSTYGGRMANGLLISCCRSKPVIHPPWWKLFDIIYLAGILVFHVSIISIHITNTPSILFKYSKYKQTIGKLCTKGEQQATNQPKTDLRALNQERDFSARLCNSASPSKNCWLGLNNSKDLAESIGQRKLSQLRRW